MYDANLSAACNHTNTHIPQMAVSGLEPECRPIFLGLSTLPIPPIQHLELNFNLLAGRDGLACLGIGNPLGEQGVDVVQVLLHGLQRARLGFPIILVREAV